MSTLVTTGDGRILEAFAWGAGRPLIYHTGTPDGAQHDPFMAAAANAAGLRLISWSRPGYARSTPRPGRSIADVVPDGRAVLSQLGHDGEDYVAIGWSGGGPHALAQAALDPHCRAAATIGGAAPHELMGDTWLVGMADENIAEMGAAVKGAEVLEPWLETASKDLHDITADRVVAGLGGLLPDADKAVLTGDYAELLASGIRGGISTGIAGWRDDDLAFAKPWGFDLAAINVPVTIWQGGADLMVPQAHAETMAAAIPTATLHVDPAEGHLSWVHRLDELLTDLAKTAFS